jgi:hypothetical protein
MRPSAVWCALALTAILAACAPPEPLQGIDLPPAQLPDVYEPEVWAVTFSHEFEPESWEPGSHTYRLTLDCPSATSQTVDTEQIAFTVNRLTPPLDTPVYMRLVGLSTSLTGPRDVINLGAEQVTVGAVTLLGLDAAQAEAAQLCEGAIEVDGDRSAALAPSAAARP